MKKLFAIGMGCLFIAHAWTQERKIRAPAISLPKAPANTPAGSPSGSLRVLTPAVESFDAIREPKAAPSECVSSCICVACLTKASCELEKIQHKLPLLQGLINSASLPDKSKQTSGPSGPQAIAAARMMARLKIVSKESKKLDECLEKVKKKAAQTQKEQKKEKKEDKAKKVSLTGSSVSRRHRLTTSSDAYQREEFNQLTDPGQTSFKWEIREASADI